MGNTSEVIAERISTLKSELDEAIQHHSSLARWNQNSANTLMITAVVASLLAGVGGLFFGWNEKLIGGLAIVPGFIAFGVAALKLQEKAAFHFRYREGLRSLRGRLLFQLPEFPTSDNVAAVAKDLSTFRSLMQKERDTQAKFDLGQLKRHNN